MLGNQNIRILRYHDNIIPGYQDTRIPVTGYQDTRMLGYQIQGNRIPGY